MLRCFQGWVKTLTTYFIGGAAAKVRGSPFIGRHPIVVEFFLDQMEDQWTVSALTVLWMDVSNKYKVSPEIRIRFIYRLWQASRGSSAGGLQSRTAQLDPFNHKINMRCRSGSLCTNITSGWYFLRWFGGFILLLWVVYSEGSLGMWDECS